MWLNMILKRYTVNHNKQLNENRNAHNEFTKKKIKTDGDCMLKFGSIQKHSDLVLEAFQHLQDVKNCHGIANFGRNMNWRLSVG